MPTPAAHPSPIRRLPRPAASDIVAALGTVMLFVVTTALQVVF